MLTNLVLALIFMAAALLGVYADWLRRKKKKLRFNSRALLSLEELYLRFYSSKNIDESKFKKVWIEMSKTLGMDFRLLRPSDRFAVELAPVKGFPCEDEILEIAAEVDDLIAAGKLKNVVHNIETINDYILLKMKTLP